MVVILAVVAVSVPGTSATGGYVNRRTRAWINTLTAKGNFSVSFSFEDVRTTAGTVGLPPTTFDDQRVSTCAIMQRSKYKQQATYYESVSHAGCGELALTFDPIAWTGTITGAVPGIFTKSIHLKRANGSWRTSAYNRVEKPIKVDLTFTGEGELRQQITPNPNTLGVVYLSGAFWKDTTVTGSFRFYTGGSVTVPVPAGHTGYLVVDHWSQMRAL